MNGTVTRAKVDGTKGLSADVCCWAVATINVAATIKDENSCMAANARPF